MVFEEQEDSNPDIIPNDLFEEEPDDDWFDITGVIDIYIDKEDL